MIDIWENIRQAAFSQGPIEWMAVFFSIIYVILAAKENVWCWLFGFVSVILYFYIFLQVRLFSDASLQLFYAGMSVYGWISWRRNTGDAEVKLNITTWPPHYHWFILAIGIVVSLLWGMFWSFFGAALPYIDAFTTIFAVITTFMVAQKILENWLYWIVIDIVCIAVYMNREMYLTAFLFFIYVIIAVIGWRTWLLDYRRGVDSE